MRNKPDGKGMCQRDVSRDEKGEIVINVSETKNFGSNGD